MHKRDGHSIGRRIQVERDARNRSLDGPLQLLAKLLQVEHELTVRAPAQSQSTGVAGRETSP